MLFFNEREFNSSRSVIPALPDEFSDKKKKGFFSSFFGFFGKSKKITVEKDNSNDNSLTAEESNLSISGLGHNNDANIGGDFEREKVSLGIEVFLTTSELNFVHSDCKI